MAGGISANIPGMSGPVGQNMGGGTQIIGGRQYQMYSPDWYTAQRNYTTDASGAAGKAAGTYTNSYMNTAFPSLAGLTGSASSAASSALGGGALGTPGASVGGGTVIGGGGPVSSGSYVPSIKAPDMTASNDAIFAAAKDKVGQLSRASLDSLNAELGSQGMLGGGAQAQATRDIISSGAGQEGQVARDLASKNADIAADFAKTGYEGTIAQRGQDIGAQEANARLALEQRAQQYSLLNMILGTLGRAPTVGGGPSPSGSLMY